jgi:hypothetical protein
MRVCSNGGPATVGGAAENTPARRLCHGRVFYPMPAATSGPWRRRGAYLSVAS